MTYQEEFVQELINKTDSGKIEWEELPERLMRESRAYMARLKTMVVNIYTSAASHDFAIVRISGPSLESILSIDWNQTPKVVELAKLVQNQVDSAVEEALNRQWRNALNELTME